MASDDLPLSIQVNILSDFLTCPVCICELKVTVITTCGHRFCDECIRECISHHHKCPCCNTALRSSQLTRDTTYDDLIETIKREKEKAEKTYFDRLISSATLEANSENTNAEESLQNASTSSQENNNTSQTRKQFLSPIETVLKKHLKQGFSAHSRYYQELNVDYKRRCEQITTDCTEMVADLRSQGLARQELDMQTADIELTYERKKTDLKAEMSTCGAMVADAFDRYLTDHIPTLSVLPVQVTIQLLDKNITLKDVQLQPTDQLSHVRTIIQEQLEEAGNKVIEFKDDVCFLCFGPFSKCKNCEMERTAHAVVNDDLSVPDVQILPEHGPLVLHFSIKPGSIIAMYGSLITQADLPKVCFVNMFRPDKPCTMDYFSCQTCGFNWVCRSCAEVCHEDHQITPLIMNHQPTWACCYCAKKKKCKIQNL